MDKSGIMHMLIGEYNHSIDPKKRLAVPAKLRKIFGDRAIITRGPNSCLFLYPVDQWQKVTDKLGTLSLGQGDTRSFSRLMFSGAMEVELDQLGRILVPDYLKNYADLKQRVTIVGVNDRLEIWDDERWANYKVEAEKNMDMLAEKLGELGLY